MALAEHALSPAGEPSSTSSSSSAALGRAPAPTPASLFELARAQLRARPVLFTGGLWAACLGGTLLHLARSETPLQLKVIQGRIVAQGALLGGVLVAAAYHFIVEERDAPRAVKGVASQKAAPKAMRNFELPAAVVPAVVAPAGVELSTAGAEGGR